MTDLSVRQMARLLKKISLQDNDVVLVKAGKFDIDEVLQALKKGMEKSKLMRITVIMVEDFDDISKLNRQQMNSKGWYHTDQINKLTERINRG